MRWERLKALGIINDRGEVLDHLHHWSAFLAITEVRRESPLGRIVEFRCLVFGMPGGATIDVSRDAMVNYLTAGKKIITATRDERLGLWKEGSDVRLTAAGYVRSDPSDSLEDNGGSLPEFQQSNAGL